MSTQPLKNLGLLPVPPELKPILGFLQRADELKSQEPIVAYWGKSIHSEWNIDPNPSPSSVSRGAGRNFCESEGTRRKGLLVSLTLSSREYEEGDRPERRG